MKVPALVLGLSPTGLVPTRSLGRRGVAVYGADFTDANLGRHSRYCTYVPELTAVASTRNGQRLATALVRWADEQPDRPVLFLTTDDFIELLSPEADRIASHFRMSTDLARSGVRFLDKKSFYSICLAAEEEIPATYMPADRSELANIGAGLRYPAIIKPAYGHQFLATLGGRKVVHVEGPEDLEPAWDSLVGVSPELIVQEVIPGGDDTILIAAVYSDSRGEPLATFVGRKIRQYPPGFGVSSLAESLWSDRVARRAQDFVRRTEFSGLCGLEYKLDARDSSLRMIEVNPRVELWLELASKAGADLAYLAYAHLTGAPLPAIEQEEGIRWTYLLRDAMSGYRRNRSGELSLSEWVESRRNIQVGALWASDDVWPTLSFPAYSWQRWRRRRA